MLSDSLRNNLRAGKAVSGCTISLNAPDLVEILGLVGFDFVWLDAEHGPFSEREIQYMVTAADSVGLPSLVRVPANDPRVILRFMDVGASGIIVPDIENKEEAMRAIHSVKYMPYGERGLSSTRSARYGMKMPLGEYTKYANEHTVVICQIESLKGVENAEEILKLDLLDGIIIGTTDLSNSMGVAGQRDNPQVNDAVHYVMEKAKDAGKPVGAIVRQGESPQQYLDQGYRILVGSGNGFFSASAKRFIKEFKAES